MDIIFGIILTFSLLIFSIFKGIFIGYTLIICFFIFFIISFKKGFSIKELIKMSYFGGKDSFNILLIFALIGAITSIWMASGTVPGIIYYVINFIEPNFFILYAFLICSAVSFILGTSFGTISTIGIALIIMAKSGNINISMASGAIISGTYFGDRCSPMSSSAHLIASLSETNIYTNVVNMFKTSVLPFIITFILYFLISMKQPLNTVNNNIDANIMNLFNIQWIVLLPAILILILSLFKINVKLSMLISIVTAFIISMTLQENTFEESIKYLLLGFEITSDSPLQNIISGGGIISMWKVSSIIFISCSLSGIFNGTSMLDKVEHIVMKSKTRPILFINTAVMSMITAVIGCSQTISIVLTNHIMKKSYANKNINKEEFAVDLENTCIVLSALIPWNTAAFVPTTAMQISSTGYIPYAFYLYLIPICNIITYKIFEKKKNYIFLTNTTFK